MNLDFSIFPPLNAGLNAASAFLILLGFVFIKQRALTAHAVTMCMALFTSFLFLASYLFYHYHHGAAPFSQSGWIRPVYFSILATHTVLAVLVVPLSITTVCFALLGRFDRHVKIARVLFPIWLYVSVTGVTIYWMLYRL